MAGGKRKRLVAKVSTNAKRRQLNGRLKGLGGKSTNPFETHQNGRLRKGVLGRKVKGANRNVAYARSQAQTRRKKTLLVEYKSNNLHMI